MQPGTASFAGPGFSAKAPWRLNRLPQVDLRDINKEKTGICQHRDRCFPVDAQGNGSSTGVVGHVIAHFDAIQPSANGVG
jgi:hypothetical protein